MFLFFKAGVGWIINGIVTFFSAFNILLTGGSAGF
jgi:hypothetical protein